MEQDVEANDIAFFIVRSNNYTLEDLINASYIEKRFLHHARMEHYKEEVEKYKALGGGI